MESKPYLQTSHYVRRRRRRGCGGCLVLIIVIAALLLILSSITGSGSRSFPVFGNSVGVVRIEGPINESREVIKIIRSYRDNPFIKAIVVRLDTPGGAVGASEEIYQEVLRARTEDKKYVIASMGNAAASGGYYIAAAASEIYANAGTITGSIGVIAMDWNIEGLLQKVGVKSLVLKSGEHKDTGSPFRQMEDSERALLQGLVFDMYRQFFRTVLKARHEKIAKVLKESPEQFAAVAAVDSTKNTSGSLEWQAFTTGTIAAEVGATTESETALRQLADGRVLTGEQALKTGLIDGIGTLEDAIQRAGMAAKLGKKPHVVEREPESSLPALFGAHARKFWQEIYRSESSVEFRGNN